MKQSKIVNAFLNPEFYDHPVDHIELVETHISWVFLTGSFAYKIKKPVDFGFLKFITLKQRKYYCEQELLLNRRFAPDLYLDVLPVTESENLLNLVGKGEIIDYAIKMRQFDQQCLLNKLIKNNQIELQHIDNLSDVVAEFHDNIMIAQADVNFGSANEVIKPVEENFSILNTVLFENHLLENHLLEKKEHQILKFLNKQMHSMYQLIYPKLVLRKEQGHIRECHGDLHLGNITLIDNKVLLFDGIEFNDSFRWIDTMSDCAFLIMDLQDHEKPLFANHFLNRYLSKTGDYSGLSVLKFYLLYRATVRAKVDALRLQQQKSESIAHQNTCRDLENYLQLAASYVQTESKKNNMFLAISFGISGSGKSCLCSQLADRLGAIQLRSDVERKRLFSKNAEALYSGSTTHQTYTHLLAIGELVLNSGYPVIIDATFLDKKWRRKFRLLAEKKQIPFHILSCGADQKIIKQRLKSRQDERNNVSDADISVMEQQLKNRDALTFEEKQYEIPVDTAKTVNYSSIMTQLQSN